MRKDLVVFLCEDCIKDLEKYNPYKYDNGNNIPLDKIEVIKVKEHMCENNALNSFFEPQLQTPILLDTASDMPWRVKCWNSIYDREQGISEIYGKYETFEKAREAVAESLDAKYWAAYEIILVIGDDEYPVYIYANTRPLADEFLKVNSQSGASIKNNCKFGKFKVMNKKKRRNSNGYKLSRCKSDNQIGKICGSN